MEDQDTAAKLKARIGEWKAYVEQPASPLQLPAEPEPPAPFAWESASAEKAAPEPEKPAVETEKGSLVTRLVKYEEQIAELQAALEEDRNRAQRDRDIDEVRPTPPASDLSVGVEPLVLSRAAFTDQSPAAEAGSAAIAQEQTAQSSGPDVVFWILIALLFAAFGAFIAIIRVMR